MTLPTTIYTWSGRRRQDKPALIHIAADVTIAAIGHIVTETACGKVLTGRRTHQRFYYDRNRLPNDHELCVDCIDKDTQ